MSLPSPPQKAKLLVSVLLHNKELIEPVTTALIGDFGPIEQSSRWFDFNYTDYYAAEMGSPLYRRMLVFAPLIEQASLADIKCTTNALEAAHAVDGNRRFNLDPGYLLPERFVLATGKNFTHRIYLGTGIYADLTLIYQKGGFRSLPWTYPDYASDEMHGFLTTVRRSYLQELTALQRGEDRTKGDNS